MMFVARRRGAVALIAVLAVVGAAVATPSWAATKTRSSKKVAASPTKLQPFGKGTLSLEINAKATKEEIEYRNTFRTLYRTSAGKAPLSKKAEAIIGKSHIPEDSRWNGGERLAVAGISDKALAYVKSPGAPNPTATAHDAWAMANHVSGDIVVSVAEIDHPRFTKVAAFLVGACVNSKDRYLLATSFVPDTKNFPGKIVYVKPEVNDRLDMVSEGAIVPNRRGIDVGMTLLPEGVPQNYRLRYLATDEITTDVMELDLNLPDLSPNKLPGSCSDPRISNASLWAKTITEQVQLVGYGLEVLGKASPDDSDKARLANIYKKDGLINSVGVIKPGEA
jgi:hypothetical protein